MLKLLTFLLFIPLMAFAQNEENTISNDVPSVEKFSKTYSPDFCEFEVSFPSEPYIARKCESPDRCYDLVSYTQVYEMASTVNFRVICNPIGEEILNAYSQEVMKATLKAMTKQSVVQEFNTTYREEETYKQAGLVGEGLSGRTPTIYIAQLWIGKQSALSVEAELIGEPMMDADTLFRDVLAGVQVKAEMGESVEGEVGENEQPDKNASSEDE
ncbi:MAG: hypothetical protein AB8B83_09740 [Bdellovibrionales bacterium]